MSVDINMLKENIIFSGMMPDEIDRILNELSASERSYKKNSIVLHAGDITDSLGLILSGSVTIESNDMWGNRTILNNVEKGGSFAETYALLENEPLLVDVRANENCRILFLKVGSLKKLRSDMNIRSFKLISNLLMISSDKNLHLSGRSFHTSPKTIRGRVMAYLTSVALKKGCNEFDIPFDRQQLADYLNLERSALSKELGKMKKEGLIETVKSHFKLISPASF